MHRFPGGWRTLSDKKVQPAAGKRRLAIFGWVALAILFVLVVGAVVGYRRLTDPDRIRALVIAGIEEQLQGEVQIGAAEFHWFQGLRLFDVTVDVPEFHAEGWSDESAGDGSIPHVFECRELVLTHDPAALLLGKLHLRSITARAPHLSVIRDPRLRQSNLTVLLQGGAGMDRRTGDEALPSVELRDARLSVYRREATFDRMVEDLGLWLRAKPSDDDPLIYDVGWQEQRGQAKGHSRLNLRTGRLTNVDGGLPWMSIEAVMTLVDARYDGVGGWQDLLGLDGRVRAEDYDLTAGGAQERFATIALSHASLSIPITKEEEGLPRLGRYLRFADVDGAIRVTAAALQASFKGYFHGSSCAVVANFRGGRDHIGSLDDVDIDADLSIDQLILPRVGLAAPLSERRFLYRWSALAEIAERYDLQGVVDLHMSLSKKAGAYEPVRLNHAYLSVLAGEVCSRDFAYPVGGLTGVVEITPSRLYLEQFHGLHGLASVTMNGWMDHPAGYTTAELNFEARDVPLDEWLHNALPLGHRGIWDSFSPQGTVPQLHVQSRRTTRTAQDRGHWETAVQANFDDMAASYRGFPYPLTGIAGTLHVAPGEFQVDVVGHRGETYAEVVATVSCEAWDVDSASVRIDAEQVAVDDTLLAALPEEFRGWVEAFEPCGTFDASTELVWDEASSRMVPRCDIRPREMSVTPRPVPITIEKLEGLIRYAPGVVEIHGLRGEYDAARLDCSGTYRESGRTWETAFDILAAGIELTPELRSALPAYVRDRLANWRIDGRFDTNTAWRERSTAPGEKTTETYTRAVLDGVTLWHTSVPSPIEDVRGTLRLGADGLHGAGLAGRYEGASLEGEVDLSLAEGSGLFSFSARDLPLSNAVRDVLPESLRHLWQRSGLSGEVDLQLDEVRYRSLEPDHEAVWTARGEAVLRNVSLPGVVELQGLNGRCTLDGYLRDARGGTLLSGRINLDTAEVLRRRGSDLRSEWLLLREAGGTGRFELSEVTGRLYGGSLIASLDVPFTSNEAVYDLHATARGVEMNPFINAGVRPSRAKKDRIETVGWVDAQVNLAGEMGNEFNRQGTGGFEIKEGELYKLPVILSILNVINPTTAPDETFNYASASFFITGDQMRLNDVVLRGAAMTLAGDGTVSLADQHLDLQLTPVGRRGWGDIPFISGLVGVEVTGPLAHPLVTPQTLREADNALKQLFRRKQPARVAPERERTSSRRQVGGSKP